MPPLSGVTVVDLTRLLPGAYCTLLLADLGADVIKVEDPRMGDPVRLMPPSARGVSVYFQLLNRNKRSVTLDLRASESPAILDALLAHADVIVEGFRPQTARQIGIDGGSIRARHPRLVHCSMTGYGQTGPYANRTSHDINYQALAGLLAVDLGGRPATPTVPRLLIADVTGGMTAAAGILAALFQRERTGEGASVDISLHEAALSWAGFPGARTLAPEADWRPAGLPLFGDHACYNVYETADGHHIALGALEPKFWARFCATIGRADLVPFQYVGGPEQARVLDDVRRIVHSRTQAEWLDRFADVEACLTPVFNLQQALDDPHAVVRGAVVGDGATRFLRSPVAFAGASGERPPIAPAPALGAHTDEVLAWAGVDEQARRALRERAVI